MTQPFSAFTTGFCFCVYLSFVSYYFLIYIDKQQFEAALNSRFSLIKIKS